ncbi:cytochrome P450 [Bimuria novae-zelandiae CBS 107.79]|uniref:Cytochrome P450 n=1 Tax=Bimuria novae-zelandiae CBS 107.79 TaxID=1447943 RepID=A0A6A5VH91_9PLEO|nr:cytochrome P450 [Bimuria novae-zelandiae CBS 107.79]
MHLNIDNTKRAVGMGILRLSSFHIGIVISASILLISELLTRSDVPSLTSLQILCVSIYRVVFHPPARYPRPFVAKITDAYAGYHGWIGDVHLDAHQLHKKYGTFVRYGPNRLLVNSVNGLRDIYSHGKNVQKSTTYLPMVPRKNTWSTLTTIDKQHHRFKRGLLRSQLRNQQLEESEPMMLQYIQKLCTKLSEGSTLQEASEPRDMAQWCEFFTVDVMGSFTFGEELGMLESSENHFVMDKLHKYSGMMGVSLQIPSLAKLKLERILGFLTTWTRPQRLWNAWTSAFAARVLNTEPGCAKGIFPHIVAARDRRGNQLKIEELWAEGSFLLLAGFETSATTLAALFFYLAHNPGAYARLEAEIRSTFSNPSEICTGSNLTSCVYLDACINETMRMSPATPGSPLREVLRGGLVVDGQFVPPGIDVGCCIYALHHHPEYFEDPDTFIPERWMEARDENDTNWEERLAR